MPDKINEVYKTDTTLNNIHHSWGWSLPATDIDCLLVEYKYPNNPVALVEYKHKNWNKDFTKGPIRALEILTAKADLPFFIVIWNNNPIVEFKIYAMNNQARQELIDYNLFLQLQATNFFIKEDDVICEKKYIDFMIFIRRQK
tara:strand:+ start:45 stop:473 length:429 start_codon:yes stop_codon:yes gene_type:complete